MTDRGGLDEDLQRMEERYGVAPSDDDVPDVIIIRDRVIPTGWGDDPDATEEVYEERIYRDEFGEWQSEVIRDERGWEGES